MKVRALHEAMRITTSILITLLTLIVALWGSPSLAGCRKVAADDKISVNPAALAGLAKIGIDRQKIFGSLIDVSIPETSGCWAGASGNFDSQIVSAGTLQWNYGQNSLQPILRRYRDQFQKDAELAAQIERLMPNFGKLVFSEGCLRAPITSDCRERILAQQSNGNLNPTIRQEYDSLFESDAMIQVQVDRFVALLQSVQDDMQRLFPNEPASVRRIKWAIDTKVQQGQFPGDADVKRIRAGWSSLRAEQRRESLLALVNWYQGLSASADQGGIGLDWKRNVDVWKKRISNGSVSDEQADLLNLSFLRSRTAQGESGFWQALTFQRRTKIILSAGCVGGECVGL